MPEITYKAIKQIPYFSELSESIIVNLAKVVRHCHYESGETIYIEGEPANHIYFLETGWVKATRMTREGREQALAFMQPGEIFGDIEVLTGDDCSASVTALEPVDVWFIQADDFLSLIKQHTEFSMAIIQRLAKQVMYYIELVEDLSLRDVESRLAHTLLRHAEVRDGQLLVPRRSWTTFDEMAVRLGTVRDVLSRALKTLEAEGLLKVEKQAIILLNPKKLAERGSL